MHTSLNEYAPYVKITLTDKKRYNSVTIDRFIYFEIMLLVENLFLSIWCGTSQSGSRRKQTVDFAVCAE